MLYIASKSCLRLSANFCTLRVKLSFEALELGAHPNSPLASCIDIYCVIVFLYFKAWVKTLSPFQDLSKSSEKEGSKEERERARRASETVEEREEQLQRRQS